MLEFWSRLDPDASDKFEKWMDGHQTGYYLSFRGPGEAMLHRGYCGHMKGWSRPVDLAKNRKLCSDSRSELEAWATEHHLRWKRCSDCI